MAIFKRNGIHGTHRGHRNYPILRRATFFRLSNKVPLGPANVVDDNIAFNRQA